MRADRGTDVLERPGRGRIDAESRADVTLVDGGQGEDRLVAGRMSLALGTAMAVATLSLHVLFSGIAWWFVVVAVISAVLGVAAAVRPRVRNAIIPSAAAGGTLVILLTALFLPEGALLRVIPFLSTPAEFVSLMEQATASIAFQATPANADRGIVFVLCLGLGLLAIAADAVALTLRSPALVGLPLVVILSIAPITDQGSSDALIFALTAAAYLLLLVAGRRRTQPGLALGIGVVAILGALVAPNVLPAVHSSAVEGPGLSDGVNPVLDLGDDLRRSFEREVLEYTTATGAPHYLRLVTLEELGEGEWEPADAELDGENSVARFTDPPGLAPDVATAEEITAVDIGNLGSRWLPVPYPAERIEGLVGSWSFDTDGLWVASERRTARNQEYEVTSLLVQPTPQQLLGAGTTVDPALERYVDLPDDVPAVIGETAASVVGAAATNYEKALALQEYFRSAEFAYSEEAPVDGDYDGTSMDVVSRFLETKSGYCVHFASAMAIMARELGIPTRVVVGFLPGEGMPPRASATDGEDGGAGEGIEGDAAPAEASSVTYEVTTHDLHTWPELYFEGIGWTAFEPTPGRGALGDYADVTAEGVPAPAEEPGASAAPVPTASPSASAVLPGEETTAEGATAGAEEVSVLVPVLLGLGGVVLLLLVPALLRLLGRQALYRRLSEGRARAVDAWAEVLRTATDLALPVSPMRTPREAARAFAVGGPPLAALLEAVEREQYGTERKPAARTLADELRRVRERLTADASPRRRRLAALLPPSVWRRIAHPLRPEPRIDGPAVTDEAVSAGAAGAGAGALPAAGAGAGADQGAGAGAGAAGPPSPPRESGAR